MSMNRNSQLSVWLRALIVVVTLSVLSFFAVIGLAWAGESTGQVQYIHNHWKVFLGGAAAIFIIVFVVLLRAYKFILEALGGSGSGMAGMLFLDNKEIGITPLISLDLGILLVLLGCYLWLGIRLLRGEEFSRSETS